MQCFENDPLPGEYYAGIEDVDTLIAAFSQEYELLEKPLNGLTVEVLKGGLWTLSEEKKLSYLLDRSDPKKELDFSFADEVKLVDPFGMPPQVIITTHGHDTRVDSRVAELQAMGVKLPTAEGRQWKLNGCTLKKTRAE